VKETNYYWSEARAHGRKVPRDLVEYERLFDGAAGRKAVGEISPRYLNGEDAAERIRRDLPHVKLIVSLRNPADRAWSDYLGRVRLSKETRPFEDAVKPGETYLEWGFYAERLRRYYDRFPAAQIHVMLYDNFVKEQRSALRELLTFLEVDPDFPIDVSRRHNAAGTPRSKILNRILWRSLIAAQHVVPARLRGSGLAERLLMKTYRRAPDFPSALRARLIEQYRDDIAATSALINRDLSHWLE
jgi:hypothetical protein